MKNQQCYCVYIIVIVLLFLCSFNTKAENTDTNIDKSYIATSLYQYSNISEYLQRAQMQYPLPNANSSSGLYFINQQHPVDITIDGISLQNAYDGSIDLSIIPCNFFSDTTPTKNTCHSYNSYNVLPLVISTPETFSYKAQGNIGSNRLTATGTLNGLYNDLLYYSIKANYEQGRMGTLLETPASELIATQYIEKENSYQNTSALLQLGMKDDFSDIAVTYMLISSQKTLPDIINESPNTDNSKSDDFKHLLSMKYNAKLNDILRINGNFYYKNTQQKYKNLFIYDVQTKQLEHNSNGFGGKLGFTLDHKLTSPAIFGLKYSEMNLDNYLPNRYERYKSENLSFFLNQKFNLNAKSYLNANIEYSYLDANKDDTLSNKNNLFNFNLSYNNQFNNDLNCSIAITKNSQLLFLKDLFNQNQTKTLSNTTGLFLTLQAEKNIHNKYLIEGLLSAGQYENYTKEYVLKKGNYFIGGNIRFNIVTPYFINYSAFKVNHFFKPDTEIIYLPNIGINTTFTQKYNSGFAWLLGATYSSYSQDELNTISDSYLLLDAQMSFSILDQFTVFMAGSIMPENHYTSFQSMPLSGKKIEIGIIFSN